MGLPYRFPPNYSFTGLQSGNVPAGNYAEFDATGFLVLHGTAMAWRDLDLSSVSLGGGASQPDLVQLNGGTIEVRAFDGNVTIEQLWGAVEIGHDYAEGTDLYFHIHWMPTTAGAGSVKWQLTYIIVEETGAVPVEQTIDVTQAAGGVAWVMQEAVFPAVSGAGVHIQNHVAFRFFRNPNQDDYAADAAVMSIGIHMQIDSVGSHTVSIK
jgi:hypothetical protein